MAALGALFTVVTAGAFLFAGIEMLSLQSQSGNTVAELFDQAMGIFSIGMAGLTILAGIGLDRLMKIAVSTSSK